MPRGLENIKNIPSADKVVNDWLEDLGQNPVAEFEGKLSVLSRFLKESGKKVGILIDNLEPALNKNGEFIEKHRSYVRLLEILADPLVNSLTLITSRDLLHEKIDHVEPYFLEALTPEAWCEFFEYWGIQTNLQDLTDIHRVYGGNALAMKIFRGEIRRGCYKNKLGEFWQGERKENLLRNPDLKNLVSDQFKRLEHLDSDTYQLLYRLGCYRYQEIDSLPEHGLLSLLWDKPESRKIKIIDDLRDRSLVEIEKNQYFLHPVILVESQLRLQSSPEFKDVHINAAKFYFENAKDINNYDQVKFAFEAIYHYYEAEEFLQCHRVLLHILDAKDKLENLRCSENLWLYIDQIISVCEKLDDKLTGLDNAMNLIPLGVLYPETGKNNNAVQVSERILDITENLTENKEHNERIILAQASAYLISGRANKFIGNFSESFKACKEARKSVAQARLKIDKYMLWEGLALYELGTAHLERANLKDSSFLEAVNALILILRGACLSVGSKKISKIIYIIVSSVNPNILTMLNNIIYQIKYGKQNKSKDNDYTKEFRVIYNLGRCIFLMKIIGSKKIANAFFEKALKTIGERNDSLNKTWSYLGIAMCLSGEKAEKKYREAIENFGDLSTLCKAFLLLEYGDFMYKQGNYTEGNYKEAIKKYIELKQLLERKEPNETDFESLKALNYYKICRTYLQLSGRDRRAINDDYKIDSSILTDYKNCVDTYKRLDLPDKGKVTRLYPEILRASSTT
jgi:tetratricopeptide (TPR) repeat protein